MKDEKDKAYKAWWAAWWADPEASNRTRPLFDAGWEAALAATRAPVIAVEALNPAPPEPVTLAGIIEALGPNRGDYLSPSIEIFADGSASINLKSGKTLAFTTVQQALDFCKEATDEN